MQRRLPFQYGARRDVGNLGLEGRQTRPGETMARTNVHARPGWACSAFG
ncbi:hypothetical protein RR42_m3725 [Cupriavidus basilensis]|uniref:Uncharacterized protein n=1 Tax=Cupriavidus basilensis TaxID=68895 RepID=A0A0C4YE95_9BURK|nr:hypothetical protein RR42_m3725 [Cupriavidus basilensis]